MNDINIDTCTTLYIIIYNDTTNNNYNNKIKFPSISGREKSRE